VASSWPAFRESAIRQWAGLYESERAFYETVIARRDRAGFSGCITGGMIAEPQFAQPIWSVVNPIGGQIDLVAVKEDLP
jgi:hypothetical protein